MFFSVRVHVDRLLPTLFERGTRRDVTAPALPVCEPRSEVCVEERPQSTHATQPNTQTAHE